MFQFIRVILIFLLTLGNIQAETNVRDFVVTGVVVNSGSAQTIMDFVGYLSQTSGIRLKTRFVDSYSELSSRLRNYPDSFGWTCGAPYVEDHKKDGQQLISVPLFKGKPTYYSLILTQKNNTGKTLLDFNNQIFVYSDPRSNSGYLAPSFYLKQQGYDLKNYFRIALHAGNHEKSIEALLNGLANVAAVDEYVWLEYLKKNPHAADEVHEIQRLGPYPFTPIVTGKATSQATLTKLQQALINMSSTIAGRKLLKKFSMDGFVIKDDSFYQPIADMQRALN